MLIAVFDVRKKCSCLEVWVVKNKVIKKWLKLLLEVLCDWRHAKYTTFGIQEVPSQFCLHLSFYELA